MKDWIIDVLIKKFGPSALRGAILGLAAYIAARQDILAPLGIVYDKATHILSVNFDTLSMWAVAGLPAIGAGVIKILNHHVDALIPKKDTGQVPPAAGA